MPLFNRVGSVTIITKGEQITIDGLRIQGSIKKTEQRDSNQCIINIYNLAENTRNRITNDDSFLILELGYLDEAGTEVIFKGDITEVQYFKKRPETITNIEVKDGFKSIKNKKIALSYDSGVTTQTILDEAAKALDLPIKNLPTLSGTQNFVFNQGYTYGGSVSDLLDDITKDTRLNWSVQNNELKIYDENGSDTSVVISLNSASGMIDSPQEIKIKRGLDSSEQNGYLVVSLLQSQIEPGGRVEIEALNVPRAVFKVISTRHVFDTVDGDFQTAVEVVA